MAQYTRTTNYYIFNSVLIHTTKAWETTRLNRPNQEMPVDSIGSVDAIMEIAENIYNDKIIQGFINATENVRRSDYWEKNTKEGFSDAYIHARAMYIIYHRYL